MGNKDRLYEKRWYYVLDAITIDLIRGEVAASGNVSCITSRASVVAWLVEHVEMSLMFSGKGQCFTSM